MTTLIDRPAVHTGAGIPFGRLLRVEWGKATDTRASRWLITITGVATVAIMLAPLLAAHSDDQNARVYLEFTAFVLGTLLPVVSILTLTSEWTQRTVLTTFTQEPRRGRVLGAKVSVSVLMALAAAVFGAVVASSALGLAAAVGRDIGNGLSPARVLGYVLFLMLNMLLGVAFGAVLQNSAAAIVLVFALPTALGLVGGAVSFIARWLDPGTVFTYVLEGHWSGNVAQIAVCTLLWVALPLAAGVFRTLRREVK